VSHQLIVLSIVTHRLSPSGPFVLNIGIVIDEALLKQQFGRRVKELRAEKGWSQERLAEEADLHRTYVAQVEVGLRNLSLISIVRLAWALGVPTGVLLAQIDQDQATLKKAVPPASIMVR